MFKKRYVAFIIYLIIFLSAYVPTMSYAEPLQQVTINPETESYQELLEKGLSISEIDRELDKLIVKQQTIQQQILELNTAIAQEEQRIAELQEQAGKVLRAYYMGERDSILAIILSAENLSEFIAALDFAQLIINNDQQMLTTYEEAYLSLKDQKLSLENTQQQLTEIRLKFIKQKEHQIAMEQELQTELENHEQADLIQQQLEQLEKDWNQKGLPLFEKYFQALASVMNDLPEVLSYNDSVKREGSSLVLTLTDQQLNEFLRSKNSIFQNMKFQFEDGILRADGQEADTSIAMKGTYTVVDEQSEPYAAFIISELYYNQYRLPPFTAEDLAERYDLAFYPSLLSSSVRLKEIEITQGTMNIKVELDLSDFLF